MGYQTNVRWTEEEDKIIWDIIEKHGRNYTLLNASLPNKTLRQIYLKVNRMKRELLRNRKANSHEPRFERLL